MSVTSTRDLRAGRRVTFPCFDGLRAFAALSVVVYHVAGRGFTAHSSYGIYTARGDVGVSVFFLISGFLLYRPFVVSHLSRLPPPSTGRYLVRRFLRILPAYWLALTVIVYLLRDETLASTTSALTHYSLLQIYFSPFTALGSLTGVQQSWSLCTELSFYFFLPLYAVLLRRAVRFGRGQQPATAELAGVGGLFLAGVLFKLWCLGSISNCEPTGCPVMRNTITWLPYYFDLFALGMLLAVLSACVFERGDGPSWISHRAMPWISWACALATFVGVAHVAPSQGPLSIPVEIAKSEMYGLFAFFLLVPAVFGPQDQGVIRRFLSSAPMAFLGVISYGVYLWHVAWLDEFIKLTGGTGFVHGGPFLAALVVVTLVTVLSAAASYHLFERHVLALKNLSRRSF